MMNKSIKAMSAAISGAFLLATLSAPAHATINLVSASSIQGENVLFNNGTTTGTTVFGSTNQTDTSVKFTSTSNLIASGGQADITGGLDLTTQNPNDTINYTNLAISLASGGTFNNLELNLFGGDATSVTFTLVDNVGTVFNFANLALSNGSNFFGFQGTDNETIQSASFVTSGTGIQSTRQVRLDAVNLQVSAAPEPATWGLMIIGFFGAGLAMRKSRKVGVMQATAV
jgi:hypothetical protein